MREVLVLLATLVAGAAAVAVASSPPPSQEPTTKYTIHLIPHSHCDAGWVQTVDQYYRENVTHILTNVVAELGKNPHRRFNWAETIWLSMWWPKQSAETKRAVLAMLESGQLEIIGGGWVQSTMDLASPWATVNQLSLGHTYLKQHFGAAPKRAWKIDPFGADSLTPSLMHAANMSSIVINRMDYLIQAQMNATQGYQFHWQPSATLGASHSLFTHALDHHYHALDGFDWDRNSPEINETSVAQRARVYQQEALVRARRARTRHVLIPFGADFRFQKAERQFTNMDRLMKYINTWAGKVDPHGTRFDIDIRYSTLSEYFDAVEQAATSRAISFPTRTNDFFPYCSCGYGDKDKTGSCEGFWVGHFTSYPALKLTSRRHDASLRLADALFLLGRAAFPSRTDWHEVAALLQTAREAQAVMQHHDAITGTAKDFVNKDYYLRMHRGIQACEYVTQHVLAMFLFDDATPSNAVAAIGSNDEPLQLQAHGERQVVLANSLGFRRVDPVHIAVSHAFVSVWAAVDEQHSAWQRVPSQVTRDASQHGNRGGYTVSFAADIPPMGWRVYAIRGDAAAAEAAATMQHHDVQDSEAQVYASNPVMQVLMTLGTKRHTGFGVSLNIERADGAVVDVVQRHAVYHTWWSGKYIMRVQPGTYKTTLACDAARIVVQAGAVMTQVDVLCGGERQQQYRVYQCSSGSGQCSGQAWHTLLSTVHHTTSVAAKPDTDVVSEYTSSLSSGNTFYTDNGREMLLRHRAATAPRASKPEASYYPIVSAAALVDMSQGNATSAMQMTLLVERPSGGSSLASGQLEVALQRRSLHDDSRGVHEPLDDASTATTTMALLFAPVRLSEQLRQRASLQHQFPLNVLAIRATKQPLRHRVWQAIHELPASAHVFSLYAPYYNATAVIRIANTQAVLPGLEHALPTPSAVDVPLRDLWLGRDAGLPALLRCQAHSLTLLHTLDTSDDVRLCMPRRIEPLALLTLQTVLQHPHQRV